MLSCRLHHFLFVCIFSTFPAGLLIVVGCIRFTHHPRKTFVFFSHRLCCLVSSVIAFFSPHSVYFCSMFTRLCLSYVGLWFQSLLLLYLSTCMQSPSEYCTESMSSSRLNLALWAEWFKRSPHFILVTLPRSCFCGCFPRKMKWRFFFSSYFQLKLLPMTWILTAKHLGLVVSDHVPLASDLVSTVLGFKTNKQKNSIVVSSFPCFRVKKCRGRERESDHVGCVQTPQH